MKKRKTGSHPRKSLSNKRQKVALSKKKSIKRQIKKSRSLRKRVLFHPATVFFLLCVGVLIIGWTYKSVADFYTITATVAAPVLSEGATITYPPDGYTTSTQLLNVQGTCPYGSYVNLYDNSVFSGVAWCSSGGTFSIQLDLYSGENDLVAQDYNVTNQPGPSTPAVKVTYNIPATTKRIVPLSYPPLLLQSSFQFQTFLVRQNFNWQLKLSGGLSPFIINVTWGDGQTSTFSLSADQTFYINHVYQKGGYYPIIVVAVDSAGNQKLLQLAALIKYPGQSGFIFSPTNTPTPPKSSGFSFGKLFKNNHWLLITWPSYLIIILMLSSYWLGERREYDRLIYGNSSRRR